jgi:hypothetical protein
MAVLSLLLAIAGSASGDTIPFANAWGSVQAGFITGAGSLHSGYPATPRIGASLRFSHWNSLRSRLDIAYTHFDGRFPLHFLFGAAGFDASPLPLPLELGASLALFYVRSQPDSLPRLNDDGETEFGYSLRVGFPTAQLATWTVRPFAQLDIAWTLPHSSAFPSVGVSLERRLW